MFHLLRREGVRIGGQGTTATHVGMDPITSTVATVEARLKEEKALEG